MLLAAILTADLQCSLVVAISSLTGSQLVLSLKRSSHDNNWEAARALKDEEFGL